MNTKILTTEVQAFIRDNLNTDIVTVLLKKPIFDEVSNQELAQQLKARKKCENKLPTWFSRPKMYYPDSLNIEQTSSEITARYKSGIIAGKSVVDATGGFGVDSYFFSQKFYSVLHCEIDRNLSEIATYNFGKLGVENVKTVVQDGMEFLRDSASGFDLVVRRSIPKKRPEGKSVSTVRLPT